MGKTAVTGAYKVWPADRKGERIRTDLAANPGDPEAVEIFFGLLGSATTIPKEQSDLQSAAAQVLDTIKALYLTGDGGQAPQFRLYYVRLFNIALLGLQDRAMPDIAKAGLARLVDDLIDAEGARVKNAHLGTLGLRAASLGGVFLATYLVVCTLPLDDLLCQLSVDPRMVRSFMLLWTGCFAGVWLSYAIRTTTFTLRDLVVSDADRLLPLTRLVFAGLLTMAVGLMLALGFVDVSVGGEKLSAFAREPTKALLLGLFCGISELLLPAMVGKRATDLVTKIQ